MSQEGESNSNAMNELVRSYGNGGAPFPPGDFQEPEGDDFQQQEDGNFQGMEGMQTQSSRSAGAATRMSTNKVTTPFPIVDQFVNGVQIPPEVARYLAEHAMELQPKDSGVAQQAREFAANNDMDLRASPKKPKGRTSGGDMAWTRVDKLPPLADRNVVDWLRLFEAAHPNSSDKQKILSLSLVVHKKLVLDTIEQMQREDPEVSYAAVRVIVIQGYRTGLLDPRDVELQELHDMRYAAGDPPEMFTNLFKIRLTALTTKGTSLTPNQALRAFVASIGGAPPSVTKHVRLVGSTLAAATAAFVTAQTTANMLRSSGHDGYETETAAIATTFGQAPTFGSPPAYDAMVASQAGAGACLRCQQPGHRAMNCPLPDSRDCFKCGRPGHIARECPSKNPIKPDRDSRDDRDRGRRREWDRDYGRRQERDQGRDRSRASDRDRRSSRDDEDRRGNNRDRSPRDQKRRDGNRPPITCWNCQAEGHGSWACPKKGVFTGANKVPLDRRSDGHHQRRPGNR
jgi:hypothetical protein